MCLGIPYRVVAIHDEENCLVQVGSGLRHCFTGLVEGIRVGDWLVVHAGFAVEKISGDDARKNIELIQSYIGGEEDGHVSS